MVARGPQKRGTLGHGLFGLCVNPSPSSMTHKLRGVRVDEYAYYVNKLRQNVGMETWIWRQIVTSQTAHTKYKWPPYATEWKPPWKFSAYATSPDIHWHAMDTKYSPRLRFPAPGGTFREAANCWLQIIL